MSWPYLIMPNLMHTKHPGAFDLIFIAIALSPVAGFSPLPSVLPFAASRNFQRGKLKSFDVQRKSNSSLIILKSSRQGPAARRSCHTRKFQLRPAHWSISREAFREGRTASWQT